MYIIDVRASHYKINPLLCIICTDCDRLYRQIDRQTERQTDRQTDRQTVRQTGFLFTFLNKKKLRKNPRKILTVFRKTVENCYYATMMMMMMMMMVTMGLFRITADMRRHWSRIYL